jgi:hypothetical protein
MALRTSCRRWFLRDLPHVYRLVVFSALLAVVISYCIDWSGVWHVTKETRSEESDEQRYSGSIIIPTYNRDMCDSITLDNRTGQLRPNGYIKCEAIQYERKGTPEGERLREISKAFRHEGDNEQHRLINMWP